ncbi:2-keto-3-deoxygluconate permease [Staphylococcus kloosii]|jgi:2-keto-3-deoxygluconate permease|uniref:2-keto-3-deoxygluconate permease n=1 Tax=Staphylococcus kloosii TaxID=29384 RepID=UPI00189F3647|nr:2-keto-3-deoxygluconate permease [Staphylococcus kloosii]MBF7029898.1 2-keto-3-deoxygluconate permease [Staphylococcus kloosii]MCD8879145.1 2-keto-3-deoxygluconate permease [Staphylococcus kloosii]
MKILAKIPGGIIIVPMLIAIIINTFSPGLLKFGGPTTSLLKEGNQAMMGLFLICCGSQINFKQLGLPLYKGSVLLLIKAIVGTAIGFLVGSLWGAYGVLGLTPLVLISALTSSNSSLYIAMAGEYGNSSDTGAISVFCLKDGPFITMLAMGATGLANIPWQQIVAMLIPLLIGALWGNFDAKFRELCDKSTPFVILFMSFSIGAKSDLSTIVTAGMQGIVLSFIALALGVVCFFLYNLFLKKKTPLGILLGTVAANSALTPSIVAEADPSLKAFVSSATAQAATASIITMILVPFMLTFADNWLKSRVHKEKLNGQPNLKVTKELQGEAKGLT